jgi:phosphoribosyl-ATP pyrophosphohydrolase
MKNEGTDTAAVLERLGATIAERLQADPASSYVASLAAKCHDAILKKVAEEAAETREALRGYANKLLSFETLMEALAG